MARQAAEKPAVSEEKPMSFEIDPSIHIDESSFGNAIKAYQDKLTAINKINLATFISLSGKALVHNKWNCAVSNPLQKESIERDPELLPFLRQYLQIPSLYIEVTVDAALTPKEAYEPYTDEEKLKQLTIDRPAMTKLQKLFKARILYD